MEPNITILQEVQQISPIVAGVGQANPFQVPDGYFEGFAGKMMLLLKAESISAKDELQSLSPLLNSIAKKVPFEVPAGYFEELSEQAVEGLKAIEFVNVELENLSPLMNDLKSKSVYEVPAGYFDSLPEIILAAAKTSRPAKVVSIGLGKRIMQYAAAAMVIGFLAIAGWLYFSPATPSTAGIESTVKQIGDDEIIRFLENNETDVVAESGFNGAEEMDETDMKTMLANVSDEELENFAVENTDLNNTLSN